jgi:hypothetical protein
VVPGGLERVRQTGEDPSPVVEALSARIARLAAQERFEEAGEVTRRLRTFVHGARRAQRLDPLARCAELVAARPAGVGGAPGERGGWEIVVVRHGKLAGTTVSAPGADPLAAVAAVRATAEAVARLGLAYPVDAMVDIVHALGPQAARYLTFSGASIDARRALEAGFLLEIVETDPRTRALEIASAIAANAPLSVRASKAAIAAVLSGQKADFDRAMRLGDATFGSADYAEGRAAFKKRRTPVFRGE